MKKAYLVEYSIRTRVVVDMEDDYEPNLDFSKDEPVTAAAKDKILRDADNYLIDDNVISIEEDTEVPYDPKFDQ